MEVLECKSSDRVSLGSNTFKEFCTTDRKFVIIFITPSGGGNFRFDKLIFVVMFLDFEVIMRAVIGCSRIFGIHGKAVGTTY